MTYINNFGDVGQGDVAVAGGKGVGLGGLIQGRAAGPAGVCAEHRSLRGFCGCQPPRGRHP